MMKAIVSGLIFLFATANAYASEPSYADRYPITDVIIGKSAANMQWLVYFTDTKQGQKPIVLSNDDSNKKLSSMKNGDIYCFYHGEPHTIRRLDIDVVVNEHRGGNRMWFGSIESVGGPNDSNKLMPLNTHHLYFYSSDHRLKKLNSSVSRFTTDVQKITRTMAGNEFVLEQKTPNNPMAMKLGSASYIQVYRKHL